MEGELLAQLAMLLNAGEPSMFGRVATVATMGTIATATDTHQGVHRNHRHPPRVQPDIRPSMEISMGHGIFHGGWKFPWALLFLWPWKFPGPGNFHGHVLLD